MSQNDTIYKIKDSVDLFLSNKKYLIVYYMNSRQRKSFRINDEMIQLLECIDGIKTKSEIVGLMVDRGVSEGSVSYILNQLIQNRIITEINADDSIVSMAVKQRYARQINYFSEFLESEEQGIRAQKKLMDSCILIFGCGAIGGNIALELAMAGVSRFILYDNDVVEESDAARHLFYRKEYLGLKKTEALAIELRRINSLSETECIDEFMAPNSNVEDLIKRADFVINTLDEPYIGYTSSKISRLCMKYRIAHFIAGGFDAHLASTGELIIPFVTPCVECYAGHFKEALKGWKPSKHPVEKRYNEIGGLASMTLFSTSFACIEIIKYLTGIIDLQKNYKIRGEFLFTDMSLTYLEVKRNPDCPICGENAHEP